MHSIYLKNDSPIGWKKYDNDNFYFAFFDYNEVYRAIINNKYTEELINIFQNGGCSVLNRKSCIRTFKDYDIFTEMLKKHSIEYKTEWDDVEY